MGAKKTNLRKKKDAVKRLIGRERIQKSKNQVQFVNSGVAGFSPGRERKKKKLVSRPKEVTVSRRESLGGGG